MSVSAPLPLPLRMTANEFEYCWALVVLMMSREGILLEVANEWSGNLANMREDFRDIWVDGVIRRMGFGRGFRLDFNQADGDGGIWVTVHDDRRGSKTPAEARAIEEAAATEINTAIGTFLREQMEKQRCEICKQALGTADPDAVARRDTFKHMEFAGHTFAHAKCCEASTTGEHVIKTGSTWVTLRDLSPRQIKLP